jgi:hypothetical protein
MAKSRFQFLVEHYESTGTGLVHERMAAVAKAEYAGNERT